MTMTTTASKRRLLGSSNKSESTRIKSKRGLGRSAYSRFANAKAEVLPQREKSAKDPLFFVCNPTMTPSISTRRLEVQLMVDHPKLLSADLASLIGLQADEAWNVGQTYKPSPNTPEQRYRFSRWAIRSTSESLEDLQKSIQDVFLRIKGLEQRFLLLPRDSTVNLTLFSTEIDTVIGASIDREAIRLLAQINASLDISLILSRT